MPVSAGYGYIRADPISNQVRAVSGFKASSCNQQSTLYYPECERTRWSRPYHAGLPTGRWSLSLGPAAKSNPIIIHGCRTLTEPRRYSQFLSTQTSKGMGIATLTTLVITILVSFILPGTESLPSSQPRQADQLVYHLGCYHGWVSGSRTLRGLSLAADNMTVETCASFCHRNRYFGLEFGKECYCGDTQIAPPTSSPSECSMACAGDANEKCGGPNRQNLYINLVYNPRLPATLAVPYLGCFVDDGSPRPLPDNMLGLDDMTAQKCQLRCAAYKYFGTEYGHECWCGKNQPNITAPAPDCNYPCSGDDGQLCGGANRINVWGPLP